MDKIKGGNMRLNKKRLRMMILQEIRRLVEHRSEDMSDVFGRRVDPEELGSEFGEEEMHPDEYGEGLLDPSEEAYYGKDEVPDYSEIDYYSAYVPEELYYPDSTAWHARPGDKIRRPADPESAGYQQRMYRRKLSEKKRKSGG